MRYTGYMDLSTPLKNISRITPAYAKILDRIGLFTIEDLLLYFPFRYDDFSKIVPVSSDYLGENITIEGQVIKIKVARIFKRRMTIIEASIETANKTTLKAVWFNQKFILSTIQEGARVRLAGKLEIKGRTFQMTSPAFERAGREATNTGRLVPVYSETKGLTSKWLRWQIKTLLPIVKNISEIVPREISQKFNLFSLARSIQEIHFPSSKENLVRAQKYFAFQEMFLVQLKALQTKNVWDKKKAISLSLDKKNLQEFIQNLPFKLTNAQKKTLREILSDLKKNKPMNRLLNGDVGSGKTIVAAAGSLPALWQNSQVALMAPTEVLARQHFESLAEIFKNQDIKIALLTNSYKLTHQPEGHYRQNGNDNRENLLKKIKTGKIDLIIGTHALIQKDVSFKNLALVIIDEQHRFGVSQRAFLQQETMRASDGNIQTIPHLLTMTATPIPRSLAIAFFGSLDLSVLDEMPKNRKTIITKIVPPAAREKAYTFIRKEIQKGHQAFIILPLVEDSKALSELKSAKTEHERLSKEIFPELKLGILHGRLKSTEKEKVMQKFKDKKTQILVSTSVVEVGIDIPNASVMLIEDAERFGLSQLHQFRGRVGRGVHQSYCFLFSGSNSEKSEERLLALEKTNDGFEIAQKDLEIRGPGHFFGTIQSGLPDIAMENITNLKLIKLAREEAENILKKDTNLKKYPEIKKALEKFQESVHLE